MSIFYCRENYSDFYHVDNLRHRSEMKRSILVCGARAQERLSSLENYLRRASPGCAHVRRSVCALFDDLLVLIEDLNLLFENEYRRLYDVHRKIEREALDFLKFLACEDEKSGEPFSGETPLAAGEARILATGGMAKSPGWATGVVFSFSGKIDDIPAGAILVAERIGIESLEALPLLSGLVSENPEIPPPVAARVQALGVPCLVGLEAVFTKLTTGMSVALDATSGTLYAAPSAESRHPDGEGLPEPLRQALFASSPETPDSPRDCRSVGDVLRFVRHTLSAKKPFPAMA